jgi:hypothetical protein
MTEKILSSDEESRIIELFEAVTVKIPGLESDIRAITIDGFKLAIEQMMHIADLKGKIEALDVSLKVLRETQTTIL